MQTSMLPPMPLCAPTKGSIWQHFKGKHYVVVTVARHSEDPGQWIVVYEPWGDHLGDAWARTLLMTEKNQWPGFLDLRDTEGKEHRFRHVHGPRSWAEGKMDISPLFALSKLTAEAMRIDEGRPLNDSYASLDSNPNYRRLVRVVRAAMETMFEDEEVVAPEGPAEPIPLDDVRQILEVIRYEARNPPDAERQERILKFANRALGLEAVPTEVSTVELPAELFETPKVTDAEVDHVLAQKPMPRVCETCNRDTQAPFFDGCMTPNCPRGHEPCL